MSRVHADLQRVLTAVGHQRPDHPPILLSLALQAARFTGRSIEATLRDPAAFIEAQLAMHARWQHDVVLGFTYAAAEAEAFGARVAFYDDGPPNVAQMLLAGPEDLERLPEIEVAASPPLARTLEIIEGLAGALGGRALLSGVAVGPLSGPVMWMGMARWLECLMTEPDRAAAVVARYRRFAMAWARAQIGAGAQAITWFEPLASTDMLPMPLIEALAEPALAEVVGLGAPIALHLASARTENTVPLAARSGAAIVSAGRFDDPARLRAAARGRIALLGGLDGVAMSRWAPDEARLAVGIARQQYTPERGGVVLSDAHGELPYQVSLEVIDALVDAARGT